MKRKGIILAGGNGTRMFPVSQVISKQLLLIYDKPMIYYPLSVLMHANIKDILIISSAKDLVLIKKILKNGSDFGVRLFYKSQNKPEGIAQGLVLAERFLNKSKSALICGDNLFTGEKLPLKLKKANNSKKSIFFLKKVNNPNEYGVFFKNKNKKLIIEKPKKKISNLAVTGLYFFDENATKIAKTLTKSERGEYEITDLNNYYIKKNRYKQIILNSKEKWFDMGTSDRIQKASNFIFKYKNKMISYYPEEIALNKKWISKSKIINKIKRHHNSSNYIKYLKKLIVYDK